MIQSGRGTKATNKKDASKDAGKSKKTGGKLASGAGSEVTIPVTDIVKEKSDRSASNSLERTTDSVPDTKPATDKLCVSSLPSQVGSFVSLRFFYIHSFSLLF